MRMYLFFLFLIFQMTFIGFYLNKRFIGVVFEKSIKIKKSFQLILLYTIIFFLFSNTIYRMWPGGQGTTGMAYLQYTSFTLFAFVGLLFGWTLIKDVVFLVFKLFLKLKKSKNSSETIPKDLRPTLLVLTYLGAVAAALNTLLGLMGMWQGPQVVTVDVPIKNLPPEAEGLLIAQLSDVHVGPTIHRDYVERVVEIVNSLKPHIVCLTGDAVDGFPKQLRPHLEPFLALKPPLGSYFVTGNHEYYWGGDDWLKEFSTYGFTPLMNSTSRIQHGPVSIAISGLPDRQGVHFFKDHIQQPEKAYADAENSQLKILLAHQPVSVRSAENYPYDLVLSGHTHAGQVFPVTLIIHLIQPYVKGLYPLKKGWLYVNQGTGYYGPPMRAGTIPEITLLKLVAAPG